jgi:hypothetical protein
MPFPLPFLVGQLPLGRLRAATLGVLVSVSHKIHPTEARDSSKTVHYVRYQDILVPMVVCLKNAMQPRRTDRRELD